MTTLSLMLFRGSLASQGEMLMTCLAMQPEGSSAPAAGSLPVALSSLIGRRRELRELATVLGSTRLLTLTGTGGSGKTRLALALAHACRSRFEHGAWWADLASVTGREPLAGTVAAALGIPEVPGQDMVAAVTRHLRSREALLVLDNCEQIVAECAGLAERLLRGCPGLTVLATSREALRVPGELVFGVAGLGLPSRDDDDADAVELFTERARAMSPGFTADPGNRAAIAGLVRQLDGLPLAIELAAARAGILGVAEIASRLAADAIVLRHPNRSAPARHQTLQAALDWSYRLLTGEEQILFRRLACFSGSFTLAAAETVCAGRGLRSGDVADLVAALVAKSLVLVEGTGEQYRYRMLATIRQYAERALAGSGEEAAAHAAHAAFYLRVADEARAGLGGAGQLVSLEVFEAEHDNMRAVLRRTLGAGDVAAGARLATLLWPFWYRRGYYTEARSWLERAATAALSTPVATPVRAAVLAGAGALAFLQCDYLVAAERLSKARALYEEEGDLVGLAGTLQRLGSIAREEGRYSDARKLHSESLAIWTEIGDDAGVAASRDFLGFAAWLSGDPATALDLSGKALVFFQAEGRRHEAASALLNMGVAASLSGDPERGSALLQESLEIATQTGYREGTAWALHELALIIADEDLEAAADMLAESLEIHLSLGDRWRAASVVETIAALVVCQQDPYLAATMLGAMAALRKAMRTPVPPAERPGYDRCLRGLRESLGASRFRSAWLRGEPMSLDDVADSCLRAIEAARGTSGRAQDLAVLALSYGLTEREVDVLRLLGRGLTNREIGNELRISTGTAGVHVSNILRKLGVSTRVQAVSVACQFTPLT
jgi:predicted ATPase/DNA-binding NarL/FixJ family response regulator